MEANLRKISETNREEVNDHMHEAGKVGLRVMIKPSSVVAWESKWEE